MNYQEKMNLLLIKPQDLTTNSQETQGTEDHTKPHHRDAISKIQTKRNSIKMDNVFDNNSRGKNSKKKQKDRKKGRKCISKEV